MTIMLMSALVTLLCEMVSYILQIVIFGLSIEIIAFIKIILIEVLFNTICIVIIYPIIKKLGELLENVFTENKVLTRYF